MRTNEKLKGENHSEIPCPVFFYCSRSRSHKRIEHLPETPNKGEYFYIIANFFHLIARLTRSAMEFTLSEL